MALLGNILWRFRCPVSIDGIATDFVDTRIPQDQIAKHDFRTAHVEWEDPWLAYRRRIGSIYGVAVCYKPPNDTPSKRGWNRRLWRNHENLTPDELVETIFDTALERLKRINEEIKQTAEQDAAGQSATAE